MYISPAIPDIIRFIEENPDRKVQIFRRGHVRQREFQSPGESFYKKLIADNAPRYKDIPNSEKKMKTALTRAMVEELKQKDFVIVQFHKGQYFQYDMTNKKACEKIREKLRQAMKDHCNSIADSSSSISTGVDVVLHNSLPLPALGNHTELVETGGDFTSGLPVQEQLYVLENQKNVAVQDSLGTEPQMIVMENFEQEGIDEEAKNWNCIPDIHSAETMEALEEIDLDAFFNSDINYVTNDGNASDVNYCEMFIYNDYSSDPNWASMFSADELAECNIENELMS